ncbi:MULTISPECIES: hypothetical protein [Burkholderiales]|jgi:hypothetical protein|uniref:hypothetical protein n=1 Tax=Burkholderiales TaxID=80840 RepID=UPI0012E2EC4F|nr:hypothetical protein [Xylophilus sp. Leaf220]
MPTTITLPGKRRIWLDVARGVVIDASETSVAVVHQDRDQRQYIGGTAIVRPGRLHSEIVSINKVWLRSPDGKESAHDLSEFPVDSRVGHDMSLVYGAAEGIEEGSVFGALNNTTGKFNFDKSIHCDRLRPLGLYLPPGFYKKRIKWGLIIGTGIGVLCAISAGTDVSFIVAGVIFGFLFSLPVALVQAVIRQVQGQRLVPRLNHLALAVLVGTD